jgi:hypothetical protein
LWEAFISREKKCGSTKKRVSFFAFSRLLSKSKKKKQNKTPLNQFCPKIVATIQLPHTANNKIIPNQPPYSHPHYHKTNFSHHQISLTPAAKPTSFIDPIHAT